MPLSPCRIALVLALACSLLAPGCASSPYQLDVHSAELLVGPTFTGAIRPTRCPDDAQPAIIGLQGPGKPPEWGCLLACPIRKQEYVTDVTRVPDGWYLEPTCQLACDPDEHRVSYLGFEHQAHCAPGAVLDPGQRATFARELRFQKLEQAEQDRRRQGVAEKAAREEARRVARETEGIERRYQAHTSELEDQLVAMEASDIPWSFELVQAHYELTNHFEGIRASTPAGSALRGNFAQRVEALLSKRLQSETLLGVERPRREAASDTAMRIRTCQSACDDQSSSCFGGCGSLPAGTCDSCRQVLTQCKVTCTKATR